MEHLGLESLVHAVDQETYAVNPEFDWRIWHIDGLLFTKEIYSNLPRNIPVRYEKPPGDHSGLVENFDVQSEERINQLLVQLGDLPEGRKPESIDNIVVKEPAFSAYINSRECQKVFSGNI